MKRNDRLHGFTVTSVRENDELRGRMIEMEHDRTGAKVCWVDNGARMRMFSIGFRTPVRDDSGVFHVIEHCVMNGSEKFPIKDPMHEMQKSSLAEFVNGCTLPEFSFYPACSRYDRDLMNNFAMLMDAVFAPLFLTEECIFLKEACHPEEDAAGGVRFNGIVLNEIRDEHPGEISVLMKTAYNAFHNGEPCSFFHGGLQTEIPKLTWQRVKDEYREHYHPSNCMLYLDGNVPVDDILALADEYFSRYERREPVRIAVEESQPLPRYEEEYQRTDGADESCKASMTLCFDIGRIAQEEKDVFTMALETLVSNTEAPLKKAVTESGLAEDVSWGTFDTIGREIAMLKFRNIVPDSEQALTDLTWRVFKEAAKNGFDRELVRARIEADRTSLLKKDETKNQVRCLNIMECWAEGFDLLQTFDVAERNDSLEKHFDDGEAPDMFMALTEKLPRTTVILKPSDELQNEITRQEKELAGTMIGGMLAEDPESVRKVNRRLNAWLDKPDDPEAIAAIPRMSIADMLSQLPELPEWRIKREEGYDCLFIRDKGAKTLNLYFSLNLDDYSPDELSVLSAWFYVISRLPTAGYSCGEIKAEMTRCFLLCAVGFVVEAPREDPDRASVCISAMLETREDILVHSLGVLLERFSRTRPDDRDEIIKAMELRYDTIRAQFDDSAMAYADRMTAAGMSRVAAVTEAISGIGANRWVKRFVDDPERGMAELTRVVRKFESAFCRSRLSAAVISDALPDLSFISNALPAGSPVTEKYDYRLFERADYGAAVKKDTGEVSVLVDMQDCLSEFTEGTVRVINKIITSECLWPEVRNRGGAYSVAGCLDKKGILKLFCSQNPDPKAMLQIFENLETVLRDYCVNRYEPDGYMMSACAELDTPEGSLRQAYVAFSNWQRGETPDSVNRLRKEILSTTREDCLRFCDRLKERMPERRIAVYGSEELLNSLGELKRIEDPFMSAK